MLKAMYGPFAQEIVVQLSVVQSLVWLTLLLFVLELRKSNTEIMSTSSSAVDSSSGGDGPEMASDVEKSIPSMDLNVGKPSVCVLMKKVMRKLVTNPNSYACFIGITWACIAKRYAIFFLFSESFACKARHICRILNYAHKKSWCRNMEGNHGNLMNIF